MYRKWKATIMQMYCIISAHFIASMDQLSALLLASQAPTLNGFIV